MIYVGQVRLTFIMGNDMNKFMMTIMTTRNPALTPREKDFRCVFHDVVSPLGIVVRFREVVADNI